MAHIKNRLRGLLVAFVALVAALAIVPGVANAMNWVDDEGSTTGTGSIVLEFGDGELPVSEEGSFDSTKIHVYKVADIVLNDDNTTTVVASPYGEELQDALNKWADSATPTATEAQAVIEAASTTSEANCTKTASGNTVTISGLTAGIYYIEIDDSETIAYQSMIGSVEPYRDTEGNWAIGDNSEKTTTIDVKCLNQDLQKTITVANTNNGDQTDDGKDAIYNVGDTISYKVDFSVTSNMSEFWVSDQITGADYVKTTFVLNFDDTEVTLSEGDNEYGKLVFDDQTGSFKFTLNAAGIAACLDEGVSDYYLTYDAKINDDAAVSSGVHNVVKSSEDGSSEVTKDFAGIKVYKYDEETEKPLANAEFTLYADEDCTVVIETKVTDSDGYITFDALLDLEKTYYVKETNAPTGYKIDDTLYKFSADAEDSKFKLTAKSYNKLDVPNTPSNWEDGIDLPQTGGAGTVALTAAGVVIVAGAAAFIVRSRKEN